MATLLSELVRVVAGSLARQLRDEASGHELSRGEKIAVSTVLGLAAAFQERPSFAQTDDSSWKALQAEADHDLAIATRLRTLTTEVSG